MMTWAEILQAVEAQARRRCEYCKMHQVLQGATFHLEHILPSSRGGPTVLENLAWACPSCNLHKADRVEATDPETSAVVPLFNPRTQRWSEHFRWEAYEIVGLTPVGRATVSALNLNQARRVLIRKAEELFGLFPSQE